MSRKLSERRSLSRRFAGVTMPITRKRTKWNRNWPCLCGSGTKYKNCCLVDIESLTAVDGNAKVEQLPEDIQKMIDEYREAEKNGSGKEDGNKQS